MRRQVVVAPILHTWLQDGPKNNNYGKYYFHNYYIGLGFQELGEELEVLRKKKSKEKRKETLIYYNHPPPHI